MQYTNFSNPAVPTNFQLFSTCLDCQPKFTEFSRSMRHKQCLRLISSHPAVPTNYYCWYVLSLYSVGVDFIDDIGMHLIYSKAAGVLCVSLRCTWVIGSTNSQPWVWAISTISSKISSLMRINSA